MPRRTTPDVSSGSARVAYQLERIEEATRQRTVVDLAFAGNGDPDREPVPDDQPMNDIDRVRVGDEFACRDAIDRQRSFAGDGKAAGCHSLAKEPEFLVGRNDVLVLGVVDAKDDLFVIHLGVERPDPDLPT